MTKKVGTATFVDGLDRVIQLKTDVDAYENGAPVQKHRVSGITAYNKFALKPREARLFGRIIVWLISLEVKTLLKLPLWCTTMLLGFILKNQHGLRRMLAV